MATRKRGKPASLPAIRLRKVEQRRLKEMMGRGRHASRVLKRVRVLQLLHRKMSAHQTSIGAGVAEGTVYRVARRYADGGIEGAIYERVRPGKKRLLGPRQEAALVAMVCTEPPAGRARWTVRLIAQEAIDRNVVATVSRETVRGLLAEHALKPWREKNVVRASS